MIKKNVFWLDVHAFQTLIIASVGESSATVGVHEARGPRLKLKKDYSAKRWISPAIYTGGRLSVWEAEVNNWKQEKRGRRKK